MPTCSTCAWQSDGFQDPKGFGFCYSEEDYVDPDGTCPFWQKSLRPEPLNEPPLWTPFPVEVSDET
jgi:hypothetical protein